MKWFLLGVELLLLWMLYSMTLLVPGDYDPPRLIYIAVFATLSFACAYASGRHFRSALSGEQKTNWEIISTPPLMVWMIAALIIALSVVRMVIVYISLRK